MFIQKTWWALFLPGLLVSSMLSAQIRSATITGTVRDAAGAVVPNANVTVTQQETGVQTSVKTTEAGIYNAPYLAAGTYTVDVSQMGFAPYKQTGITLAVSQTVRVDVELRVGA